MQELNFNVILTTIDCGVCAGTYAISERYRQERSEEGKSWHCPYCRTCWGYASSGENAELKRKLAAEKKRSELAIKRTEWAKQEATIERNRANAFKGQVTKIKNRVSKGVCPCCTRTFQNLARHMHTKHPNYGEGEK